MCSVALNLASDCAWFIWGPLRYDVCYYYYLDTMCSESSVLEWIALYMYMSLPATDQYFIVFL